MYAGETELVPRVQPRTGPQHYFRACGPFRVYQAAIVPGIRRWLDD